MDWPFCFLPECDIEHWITSVEQIIVMGDLFVMDMSVLLWDGRKKNRSIFLTVISYNWCAWFCVVCLFCFVFVLFCVCLLLFFVFVFFCVFIIVYFCLCFVCFWFCFFNYDRQHVGQKSSMFCSYFFFHFFVFVFVFCFCFCFVLLVLVCFDGFFSSNSCAFSKITGNKMYNFKNI